MQATMLLIRFLMLLPCIDLSRCDIESTRFNGLFVTSSVFQGLLVTLKPSTLRTKTSDANWKMFFPSFPAANLFCHGSEKGFYVWEFKGPPLS